MVPSFGCVISLAASITTAGLMPMAAAPSESGCCVSVVNCELASLAVTGMDGRFIMMYVRFDAIFTVVVVHKYKSEVQAEKECAGK